MNHKHEQKELDSAYYLTEEIFGKAFDSTYSQGTLPYLGTFDKKTFDDELTRLKEDSLIFKKYSVLDKDPFKKEDTMDDIRQKTKFLLDQLEEYKFSSSTKVLKECISYDIQANTQESQRIKILKQEPSRPFFIGKGVKLLADEDNTTRNSMGSGNENTGSKESRSMKGKIQEIQEDNSESTPLKPK